ncbi:MAG: cation:proton antiporter [Ignisphaera sp.]|nr:cation:proton antiporter [Ignisphaera sp.]
MERLLLDLVLLYAVAKGFEWVLRRFNIVPAVAYIAAGIVLGSSVLGVVKPSDSLEALSYLGLLLLLLYTGLTTSFSELRSARRWVVAVGVGGIAATIALGFSVLKILGFDDAKALLISIILSNTATEIVAASVTSIHNEFLKSLVVGASLADDIMAVLVLSTVSSLYTGSASLLSIARSALFTALLLVGITILGDYLVSRPELFYKRLAMDRVAFASTSMLLATLMALLTRVAGLGELIGVYMAGLLISRSREVHDPLLIMRGALTELVDQLSVFIEALALPLFFTYIGLVTEVKAIDLALYSTLLLVAITGKLVGCGVPAYFATKSKEQATLVGFAMIGRGALETALLKILLDTGIISVAEYTTILLTSLTTSVLAPQIVGAVARRIKA